MSNVDNDGQSATYLLSCLDFMKKFEKKNTAVLSMESRMWEKGNLRAVNQWAVFFFPLKTSKQKFNSCKTRLHKTQRLLAAEDDSYISTCISHCRFATQNASGSKRFVSGSADEVRWIVNRTRNIWLMTVFQTHFLSASMVFTQKVFFRYTFFSFHSTSINFHI